MGGNGKLRFGICGLGFMGRTYFSYLTRHADACVVAVCDSDPRRRQGDWSDEVGNIAARDGEQQGLAGISTYDQVAALFGDANVDIVAVTLPTPLHAEAATAALEAGKHVICEKPMALTLADCDRMIRASAASGRTLMIAQCVRFWPQYETIKRIVDEGGIGPVRFVTLRRLASPPEYSADGWLLDGARSGGALFDLHVHDVDFAQHLLGTPASIHARGGRGPSGAIDHVIATYGYEDGRYALLEGGWIFHAPWPFEMAITVCGERGTLDWNSRRGAEVLHYTGEQQPRRITCEEGSGWMRELDYVISCIRDSRAVERCTPESARTSIALALLEKTSIEEAGPVTVSGLP